MNTYVLTVKMQESQLKIVVSNVDDKELAREYAIARIKQVTIQPFQVTSCIHYPDNFVIVDEKMID